MCPSLSPALGVKSDPEQLCRGRIDPAGSVKCVYTMAVLFEICEHERRGGRGSGWSGGRVGVGVLELALHSESQTDFKIAVGLGTQERTSSHLGRVGLRC